MRTSPSLELAEKKLRDIANIILVGSGKGGVGKTVISSAIALSLARMKFKTGILDADLHGPSLHKILDCRFPAKSGARGIIPCTVHGLKFMSIAFFVDEYTPLPIKGNAKASLVRDLFAQTDWGELDYLVVDLPPGTGDEVLSALTLFSSKGGTVIVSTPSLLAISVVERLINLLEREGVSIIGLIENMAYIYHNSEKLYLFKSSAAEILSKKYGIDLLGTLPLDPGVEEAIIKGGTPLNSKLFAEEFQSIVYKIVEKTS